MATTASPSEYPGARLNERVTEGNKSWWLIVSGDTETSDFVSAESGTNCPVVVDRTYSFCSDDASWRKFGVTSRMTRFWLGWLKTVATCRSPEASYKTSSMATGEIPKRPMVLRSILSITRGAVA